MERKEQIINRYLICLAPAGIAAVGWSIYGFPVQRADFALLILSVITVFFSSYLRIQLPRTKIHLTISDALIFLSFLRYGGEVAVMLAVLETAFTSLNFRRQGVTIRFKTVMINILIAAVSAFGTAMTVKLIFGSAESVTRSGDNSMYLWLLAAMAIPQFLINSILVASFLAIKTGNTVWGVWNDYCLNAFVMFFSGAALAGVCHKSLDQINIFMFIGVVGIFAVVYLTYRRYTDDVRRTGAKAENAERERAEQAEEHVRELQHYVAELEKSGKALAESREKFRHAAYHDALTGLPNRNQFLEVLKELLAKSRLGENRRFAVLFLDLNRFKMLNESLGHSVGDRMISDVGERLSQMVRETDLVGRFSGDEFAILLKDLNNTAAVMNFAEKVAKQISEPFTLEGRQIFTSVSIGIAFGTSVYNHAEEILRDADIAMYYAKETQRNYVIFDREMHTRAVSLLELETDLRFAVDRNEFELFYQPIVDLDDLKLKGFEALIRWNHPTRGLVPPFEFISLAESTGIIIPMTITILRQACRQMAAWQRQSDDNANLIVSVNLSAKHFKHPALIDEIRAILIDTGLRPSSLKLEITESAVMENAENAIEMLQKIKATGVTISIDDFGTGYSSLSYLHRFPIDTLKIDRSFVSTMESGSENGEIVRTVIALARALKLNVIAEGIESIHQLHQLRNLGCEMGQGYLFSRPLPVGEIEKLLADTSRWRNILPPNEFGVIAKNAEYTQLRLPH